MEGSESAEEASLADILPGPTPLTLAGAKRVAALLPNGRVAWLRLHPEPARVVEMNHLARSADIAALRHAAASQSNAQAIERVSREAVRGAKRITRASNRGARELRRRLVAGDAELHQQFEAESAKIRAEHRADEKRLREMVRSFRRCTFWDAMVVASGAPLFAAYGQRGDPFGVTNVTLAVALAVWLVGDEVADFFTGERRAEADFLRGVDVWSYIAPFANLLTGWWLLRDGQHERFVSGIASSFHFNAQTRPDPPAVWSDRYTATIDLAGVYIAPDYAADFASFFDVPAVAAVRSATLHKGFGGDSFEIREVTAVVTKGLLVITVTVESSLPGPNDPGFSKPNPKARILEHLEVAWIVDTQAPASTVG